MTIDPQRQDFEARIARWQAARALGHGFEAEGTLGRSYHRAKPARRRLPVAPALFVVLMLVLLKGAIHHQVGQATYDRRVAALMAEGGFARLGARVMQAGPVTLWVSDRIDRVLAQL